MEEVSAFAAYSLKKSKDKKEKQKTESNKKNRKSVEFALGDIVDLKIASDYPDENKAPRNSLEFPSYSGVENKRPPKRTSNNRFIRNYSSDDTVEEDEKNSIKRIDYSTIKRSKRTKNKTDAKLKAKNETKYNYDYVSCDIDDDNEESDFEYGPEDIVQNIDYASDDTIELIQPLKKKKNKNRSDETRTINTNLSTTLEQMKIDPVTRPSDFNEQESSIAVGQKVFQWIIAPVDEQKFIKYNWEEQPIQVARHCPSYYKCLISCEHIDRVVREKNLYFGKNIDVTSYTNGLRETHNPPGRATAPVLWDYYNNGCSIRILNPQTFFKKIHCLNAKLQEYFGCFVGANVYLTPPGKQGFAPHYDDIEAFVLQVEGRKHWKIYAPRSEDEILPRESSPNFNEHELGEVLMDLILEPGDMLYFPRGYIHQAQSVEDSHSLHITLSVYQKNSWADLLEKLIPAALKTAIECDRDYRRGLNLFYLHHMGLVHSDVLSIERAGFIAHLQLLIQKLFNYAPIDAAVDQLGKQFQIDALPPYIEAPELNRTVFGDGEVIENGVVKNKAQIGRDTKIKLLRFHVLRLVKEDDVIRIYHSVNNSKEYHGEEPQFLEISEEEAPAVEALIKNYPRFLSVDELPLDSLESKVQIASDLWEVGLLQTKEPLANGPKKLKSILKK